MSFFASGRSDNSDSDDESVSSAGSGAPRKGANAASGVKPKSAGGGGMFATGDTDSDSDDDDSDDDSSDDSSDEEEEMSDDDRPKTKSKANAFLRGGGSDSDSSDEDDDQDKTAIKSAKDKREDELDASLKTMENAGKTGERKNWVVIATEFDKVLRLLQRSTLTALPGTTAFPPPQFLRALIALPADVDNALKLEKSAAKKSSQANAKALNGMKQKVKKVMKENEDHIKSFEKDEDAYVQTYVVSTRGAEDSAPKKPKAKKRAASDDETGQVDEDFMTVGKGGKALDLTKEGIFKTLKAIQEARGRKNTDRREQVAILSALLKAAGTPYQKLRVLLTLISLRFDFNPANHSYMPLDDWAHARAEVTQLLDLLLAEGGRYVVSETLDGEEFDDMVERVPGENGEKDVVKVLGSLIGLVERLDDEFTKSLQWIDAHGMEYVERLKDESVLYAVLVQTQSWFEAVLLRTEEVTKAESNISRVVLRRLEHVYSKPDQVVVFLEQAVRNTFAGASSTFIPDAASPTVLVHSLCVYLYRSSDSLIRTRAMLSHIYHHALQGRYFEARDMLLMSHLQSSIQQADEGTQILYNRAMVQLGLAAFRLGLIAECRTKLLDLFTTQRQKELLAQGFPLQKFTQSTPEQERADKLRTLPFHLHINLELVEAAFLVSCMLFEVPMLAKGGEDESGRWLPSKPFKKLLDQADRQTFMGAPETTRNCIEQASKALQNADWEGCRDLIQQIKIWALMPDSKAVKEMLARKIQEEGLRTYLITFAPFYTTCSLSLLSSTFSLPVRTVTSVVSKMIHNNVLPASLDQIDQVVVFYRVELTKVQQLASSLADRVKTLNDANQKALEAKLGTGGERGEGRERDGGEGRGSGERRRGGGVRGGRGGRGRGGGAFASSLGAQRKATAV